MARGADGAGRSVSRALHAAAASRRSAATVGRPSPKPWPSGMFNERIWSLTSSFSTPSAITIESWARANFRAMLIAARAAPARGVHGQAARQLDELGLGGFEQLGGRESLAEVVDRKPDARAAIRCEHDAEAIEVANALVLADLEDESIRRASCPFEQQEQLIDVMQRIEQCRDAHIHEERHLRGQRRRLAQRRPPAQPVEISDMTRSMGDFEERLDAVRRAVSLGPRQRLVPGHMPVVEIDDRLVHRSGSAAQPPARRSAR